MVDMDHEELELLGRREIMSNSRNLNPVQAIIVAKDVAWATGQKIDGNSGIRHATNMSSTPATYNFPQCVAPWQNIPRPRTVVSGG